MFSQSLCIGNDTLLALDFVSPPTAAVDVIDESPTNKTSRSLRSRRPACSQDKSKCRARNKEFKETHGNLNLEPNVPRPPQQAPESIGVIDESPTSNNTASHHKSHSSRLRSQHRSSKTVRHKHKPCKVSSDGYSGFEKVQCIKVAGKPKATVSESHTTDSSLDKYFSSEFESQAPKTTAVASQSQSNLDVMFEQSDFFSQMNESSEPKPLDVAITHDKIDLSFGNCSSFTEPNQPVPRSDLQAIAWDDSSEFNNIAMPPIEAAFPPDATNRQTDLMVDEDVALGIDNVTFTQEFLRQCNVLEKDRGPGTQKSVAQFMSEEMHKCMDVVKSGLSNEEGMASTSFNESNQQQINNRSSLSNIVLNWSPDSVPKAKANVLQSQVQSVTAPRSLPKRDLSNIDSWGLSKEIVQGYVKKGITTMFPWQVECLSNTKVLFESANLVYSAPTSAGKTLVSELLMIKNVLEQKKKSLFILPFISVVREKMFYMQELLAPAGLCVEGFFGGYSPPGGFDSTHIAICTIEKANSIVNKLLEQHRIDQIGCVVVDEIHLISDPGRGYILELLLTKVLYMCRKYGHRIQIVCMSATLPNIDLLTKWLDAQFYRSDFRPVALREMIKIDTTIFDGQMQEVRRLNLTDFTVFGKDQDNVGQLCVETILEGCSVLIFCPSKDWCESLSTHVAGYIYAIGKSKTPLGDRLRRQLCMEAIDEMRLQLRNCPTGLDAVLGKVLSYGCGFHHAGLTTDERDIVESSFKSGALKVIVATSTLSSGVNLPARRVIIRSPMFGGKPMNSLTYKQMIGRAGRTGKDTLGESILICGSGNISAGKELLSATLRPIASCLDVEQYVHLKRAVLEIIAASVATTKADLEQFANCTLLASDRSVNFVYVENDVLAKSSTKPVNDDTVLDPIADCMTFLLQYEFVRMQLNEDTSEINYMATRLGAACLASSMPPNDGFLLFSELQKSRQNFVLESDLHAVYLVTPFSVCYQMQDIDWLGYLDMWERLPASTRRVGEMVGVRESFLVKAMRGHKLDYKTLQIHKRFYTALALLDLVNESPVNEVADRYKCSRGLLQSLQQMASTFAGIVTAFCRALNWSMLALIIDQFKERLFFGVHRDLIELMRLPNLNGQRARLLFDAGFQSLTDVARADVFSVERLLYNSVSFETTKQRDGETDYDAEKRQKTRFLFVTGKSGLTVRQAAMLIIEDARRYLEAEMGLTNVQWLASEEIAVHGLTTAKVECVQLNTSPPVFAVPTSENTKPTLAESEDIFASADSRKRQSSELVSMPQADGSPVVVRKSPRLHHLQQITNHVASLQPKKLSPEKGSDDISLNEIASTPVPASKTQRRTQRTGVKTKPTKSHHQNVENHRPQQAENPMQNLPIDVNDFDSIGFSDAHSSRLNDSHILSIDKHSNTPLAASLAQLHVVNVCGHGGFFERFCEALRRATTVGLAVAVGCHMAAIKSLIGGNLMLNQLEANASLIGGNETTKKKCTFDGGRLYVAGVSICLAELEPATAFYLNLQDDDDAAVPFCRKVTVLDELFGRTDVTVQMFDAREQCKTLAMAVPKVKSIAGHLEDPRVANWLLRPDDDSNLVEMAQKYAPECVALAEVGGTSPYRGAISQNAISSIDPKVRASIECCVTVHVLNGQKENLNRIGNGEILKSFLEMEMPIQRTLFQMEVVGLAVDAAAMTKLGNEMDALMRKIEQKIFQMNGKRFNIASSADVAKVLGMRTKHPSTVGGTKVSTAKAVLEKLSDPMALLIRQHRKLGATLNKTLRPLMRSICNNRVHGNSMSFTSTGRISMQEPNLQNIAKDFTVAFGNLDHSFSCRSVFRAHASRSLIAADFCQLELRILTHLSGDQTLMKVMNSPQDVFTTISARWNRCKETHITEQQRNDTKQLCYGIIYGMGTRSLAEALGIDDEAAQRLCESFHQTYPGLRRFTDACVKYARQQGFVETLAGRRRYLPHINSADAAQRSQAERQAINTSIQGSAADVAKYAMLRMERNLRKYEATLGINVADDEGHSHVQLVLHLHDELMYEVPADKVTKIVRILKSSMENCAKLNVPLLVKIKAGSSWGSLSTVSL